MSNVFLDLVNNMIGLNLDSLRCQATVGDMNSSETNANEELCNLWTTCPESSPNDPGYKAYVELFGGSYKDPATGKTTQYPGVGKNNPSGMQDWITKFLSNGAEAYGFSSFFMTEVYSAYEQNQPSSPNPTTLALISSVGSMISSMAQANEQPGENAISTLNTMSQHFQTDQGPLSQSSNTLLDGLNNYASAMQQISA